TIVDDNGPDDEPGQKDLSFLTVDYGSPGAPLINVQWGWDDTATSGANTRDGCVLFDSDRDGNANFSVCVTVTSVGGGTTVTYQCGAAVRSRCLGAVPGAGATSNATAPTTPGSDPFGGTPSHRKCSGPACITDDTVANATIVMADVGGVGSRLVNVCSYPSG